MERIFQLVEEEDGKKVRLKGKRSLRYKTFGREDEKEGRKDKIIEDSIGYVVLKELKQEEAIEDKPEAVQKRADDTLTFYEKKYVIWKKSIDQRTESEWKTGYLTKDENDIYRLKDCYIKGYCQIQNEVSGEQETVLLVSKTRLPLLFLLFLLPFFTAVCVQAFYHPDSSKVPVAESPVIEFAEDATEYDDTPIMTEETEEDRENSDIMLNVFVDQTLNAGDTIPFANYSTNVDKLEFQVTYAGDNNVIYDTGIISPGQQVKWNVSDTLKSGNYCFDIYLLVYPSDGTEASYLCFQKNFNVVLK